MFSMSCINSYDVNHTETYNLKKKDKNEALYLNRTSLVLKLMRKLARMSCVHKLISTAQNSPFIAFSQSETRKTKLSKHKHITS